MKKKILFLVALFVLLLPVSANAANPKLVSLDSSKTYTKYDVTGNGTKDKFKYVVARSYGSATGDTYLYLNGKKRNTIFTARGCNIKLVSFDKKNVFLAVNYSQHGGWALDFYKYSGGKFKKIYSESSFFKNSSYIGYRDIRIRKMSGKTLYITQGLRKGWDIQCVPTFKKSSKIISWDMKYTVKSGKIVLASRTATVNGSPTFTALSTFKTAKSAPTSNYNSFTVKKGDKVKLTKIYFPSGGKTAWFKIKKGSKEAWFQSSSKRLLK